MKVAASNVNININHLIFKQQILGVRVTIAQQKTSGGLKEVCYEKLHYESRLSRSPKSPLFRGHDFKVFPNELLMRPE